jgi:hypothetical protein
MTMKKRKKEKTIFRTILFAMLLVLGIEIVLLVSALYLSNVSTRLNQNAMDLLDMQTSNRADYLESILLFNRISPGFLLVSTKKLLNSPLPKSWIFPGLETVPPRRFLFWKKSVLL